MKKLLMIILIGVLLVGCSSKEKEVSDSIKFKEEYESINGEVSYGENTYRELSIDKDNPIIYKSAKDIVEMIDNKETFVVYFGFSTCPWCRSVISNLINVSKDLEIDTIYYVDVKEIRDVLKLDADKDAYIDKEGTNDYYDLLDRLNDVLDDYTLKDEEGNEISTNRKRIYAPNIVAVVDGNATKMTTGISDKQEDAYMQLTDEINKDSYDMIKCVLECTKKEKDVCPLDKSC